MRSAATHVELRNVLRSVVLGSGSVAGGSNVRGICSDGKASAVLEQRWRRPLHMAQVRQFSTHMRDGDSTGDASDIFNVLDSQHHDNVSLRSTMTNVGKHCRLPHELAGSADDSANNKFDDCNADMDVMASYSGNCDDDLIESQNTRSIVTEGEGGLPIGGVQSGSSTASRQPTERQVAFANRLATEVGTTIPAEALESISSMSDYIANLLDQQKESHHGDQSTKAPTDEGAPATAKQVAFVHRLCQEKGVRLDERIQDRMAKKMSCSRLIDDLLNGAFLEGEPDDQPPKLGGALIGGGGDGSISGSGAVTKPMQHSSSPFAAQPPSKAQVELMVRIAQRATLPLPADVLTDRRQASRWIDTNKHFLSALKDQASRHPFAVDPQKQRLMQQPPPQQPHPQHYSGENSYVANGTVCKSSSIFGEGDGGVILAPWIEDTVPTAISSPAHKETSVTTIEQPVPDAQLRPPVGLEEQEKAAKLRHAALSSSLNVPF